MRMALSSNVSTGYAGRISFGPAKDPLPMGKKSGPKSGFQSQRSHLALSILRARSSATPSAYRTGPPRIYRNPLRLIQCGLGAMPDELPDDLQQTFVIDRFREVGIAPDHGASNFL